MNGGAMIVRPVKLSVKKRLGKSETEKAQLSKHADAPARRLKRAIAWHKRVKDDEDNAMSRKG